MRRYDKDFYLYAREAVEDVVRKSRNSKTPNARSELNSIPFRVLADPGHCCFKRCEVARTESPALVFVVGDVLEVFNSRCFIEEVAHLSKACA